MILVRVIWCPLRPKGRGALRLRDNQIWEHALWCQSCGLLGYDPSDIDAVIEAGRLGVDTAPRVVACGSCDRPTCDQCKRGTTCKRCA